jgi:hypothetical protein
MPHVANQYDIDFYNLVHTLRIEASSAEQASPERRRRNRKPYAAAQRISPIRGSENGVRSPSPFFLVHCCDLNEGGFSFLLPYPPDFRELVVALGQAPEEIIMLAAVAHWHEAKSNGTDGNRPLYQVGCRFVRRLVP